MTHSDSQQQTSTSTQTSLTTTNLNTSGNSGLTVSGNEGPVSNSIYNYSTDAGAIAAGSSLAQHALDTATATTNKALDTTQSITQAALSDVTQANSNAYGQALTAVQHSTDSTVSAVESLATQFGTALTGFEQQSQTQLGNVTSALASSYESNNTSASQQAINSTQTMTKYILIAAVAVAALFFLSRGRA